MSALPIGTKVQLSTGTPRPKRGEWVIKKWLTDNGQGAVEEVGPNYIVVVIETRADGSQVILRQSRAIYDGATHFTVTPL